MKQFSLCLALLSLGAGAAHADLSFTQTATVNVNGPLGNLKGMVSKTAMQDGMSRVELNMGGSSSVVLKRDDVTTEFDPTAKIYTAWVNPPKIQHILPKNVSVSSVAVTVKKLPPTMIGGSSAPHWLVNMQFKATTPYGPKDLLMGLEVWPSDVPVPDLRISAVAEKLPSVIAGMLDDKVKLIGDISGLDEIFVTVPLRMKVLAEGQLFETVETTNLSTANLPASLFALPTGYKKVTLTEYRQSRQASIERQILAASKNVKPNATQVTVIANKTVPVPKQAVDVAKTTIVVNKATMVNKPAAVKKTIVAQNTVISLPVDASKAAIETKPGDKPINLPKPAGAPKPVEATKTVAESAAKSASTP